MPKFLTIFPNAENVHLIKDIGMIPFVLHKEYGYVSTIASYNNGTYPYLDAELKGLKQVFIERKFKNEKLNVCLFILLNFKKFDTIQCYHISINSIVYLLFFKFLKSITFSRGLTYLKFDANDSIKGKKISKKIIFLLKKIKILSVETKTLHSYLNNDSLLKGFISYVPSGYYNFGESKIVDFSCKENLIITVGRIGNKEKSNEVLLTAFADFAKKNDSWKLELVGPIEDEFHFYIENYFKENPGLRSRVVFSGNITDREVLQEKYRKAKIFVLTSKSESFGIVLVEAIANGCFLFSTNFSSAKDITDNGRYGILFDYGDTEMLSQKILEVINNEEKLKEKCLDIQNFAFNNFSWKKICGDIDLILNKK